MTGCQYRRIDTVEVNSRIRETRSNQESKHQMILLEALPRLTG
jgi:hypothetical protein